MDSGKQMAVMTFFIPEDLHLIIVLICDCALEKKKITGL
jgi:hypothetical protein